MPDIKQTVTFDARPSVIFEALMSSRKHSEFTGAPAKIGAAAGRPFAAYGGYITGFNLDITKNKSIVQAWRAKNWPNGVWSVASFKLVAAKGGKTKLSFSHTGVPAKAVKGTTDGWKSHYWAPLKATIKASKTAAAKPKKAAAARRGKTSTAARKRASSAARKPAARGRKSATARRATRARATARIRRRT